LIKKVAADRGQRDRFGHEPYPSFEEPRRTRRRSQRPRAAPFARGQPIFRQRWRWAPALHARARSMTSLGSRSGATVRRRWRHQTKARRRCADGPLIQYFW